MLRVGAVSARCHVSSAARREETKDSATWAVCSRSRRRNALLPIMNILRFLSLLAVLSAGDQANAEPPPAAASSATQVRQPAPRRAQPADEKMDEWGVWNTAATSPDSDPLLGVDANEDKSMRDLDDGVNPESADYPVGVGGADELRLNTLDASAIGDFGVNGPVAPHRGGDR